MTENPAYLLDVDAAEPATILEFGDVPTEPILRPVPVIHTGYAIDMLDRITEPIDLLVTDPPYAMGGEGAEHAMSASVATTLRELGHRVRRGGWAVVYAASSWRSTYYMVESLRGVLEPVRIGTWCKPVSRSKVRTPGWAWASVNVIVFKRPGRGGTLGTPSPALDHIVCAPLTVGRRAQLPPEVAAWSVEPFSTWGGLAVDPFAGSGALLEAAADYGMRAVGFDADPLVGRPEIVPSGCCNGHHPEGCTSGDICCPNCTVNPRPSCDSLADGAA